MVRILDRFNKQNCRDNKIKMRIQTAVDVIPISIAHVQSQLQQNNIGITYARTSKFRMEPARSMSLYFVVMPQSILQLLKFHLCQHQLLLLAISNLDHTLQGEQNL